MIALCLCVTLRLLGLRSLMEGKQVPFCPHGILWVKSLLWKYQTIENILKLKCTEKRSILSHCKSIFWSRAITYISHLSFFIFFVIWNVVRGGIFILIVLKIILFQTSIRQIINEEAPDFVKESAGMEISWYSISTDERLYVDSHDISILQIL